MMQDVKTDEALRDSETRYRRLFETAQDGILILNAETGMIVDVNPFLVAMLGFSHEQFVGKTIWELGLFKDIASNKDKFMELQRQGYVRYEDMPLETAAGQRIDVEFVSNVYKVDHQKVIQCNIRDITDRKRAEKEIEDKLRETINMKLDFINEVLDFQKLEAGRSKIHVRSNDINAVIRDVYEMMTLAAKDRGIDILLELDDRLPAFGFDEDRITQVLTNLLDNAVKFTQKGHIVVKTSQANGMIHVSVSDTGCGIREKNLSRSFRMFEQLSSGGERGTGGSGLGLAICKGIIEQHDGRIWVDSVFGKGSQFTFTLPINDLTEPVRKRIDDGIREASTNNTRMSLVLMSIGDLEGLRQELSHETITSTLKGLEAILEENLHGRDGGPNQAKDTVFNFSDEFFIVLTNCAKENLQVVRERLEQKVNDYLAGKDLADKIRLSFACVTYPDDAVTSAALIEKAEDLHPVPVSSTA